MKFTVRVLKKMPTINPKLPEALTTDGLAGWIEAELRFLREVVQPALGTSWNEKQGQKQVGKHKLAYLWQTRRSKAIQIVLNDSAYPSTPACANSVQTV